MGAQNLISREVSIFFRLNRDGQLGPLNRRFFASPRAALQFFNELHAITTPQVSLVSLAEREVGDWHSIAPRELEAAAAEEVGR